MKQPDPFLEVPSMMTYLHPRQLARPIYIVPRRLRTPARAIQHQQIRSVWGQPTPAFRSTPPIDVDHQKDTLILRVSLPGVEARDLEIQASQQIVTIVARTADQTQTFRRIINLSSPIQHHQIAAKLTNGTLTLTLPKAKPSPTQAVKVEINPRAASPVHQAAPTGQSKISTPAVEPSLATEPAIVDSDVDSDVDPVLSTLADDRIAKTERLIPNSPVAWKNDPELSVDLWAIA